jgi:uncharacterized spore protein YtfJ
MGATMKIENLLARARESFDARMVFGEPVEKDGVTVIPAARIAGGGGGGNGDDRQGRRGEGGGLGLIARPVGAYVIKNGEVWWQPAVDVNRIIATLGAVAVAGLFVGSRFLRRGRGK